MPELTTSKIVQNVATVNNNRQDDKICQNTEDKRIGEDPQSNLAEV